jgi:hypothetical protein
MRERQGKRLISRVGTSCQAVAGKQPSEYKANVLFCPPVGAKACAVSFIGPSGIRHSVKVTAESLYEAVIIGRNLPRQDG